MARKREKSFGRLNNSCEEGAEENASAPTQAKEQKMIRVAFMFINTTMKMKIDVMPLQTPNAMERCE